MPALLISREQAAQADRRGHGGAASSRSTPKRFTPWLKAAAACWPYGPYFAWPACAAPIGRGTAQPRR
jgi:hypothetical protein